MAAWCSGYHNGEVLIIDVSQSVEHDHPHALEFLRKDCANINAFFWKHEVPVMTVRELFEFVTDPSITSENIDEYLEKAMEEAADRTAEERSNRDKVDDEVFKNAYIPRTLTEVTNYERDVDMMMKMKEEDTVLNVQHDNILYQTVTGLRRDLSGVQKTNLVDLGTGRYEFHTPENRTAPLKKDGQHFVAMELFTQVPALLESRANGDENSGSAGEESSESGSDEEEEEEEEEEEGMHPKDIEQQPDLDKKERKKVAKEAQREKRKNKIPKHIKKRKEKVVKMKKGK